MKKKSPLDFFDQHDLIISATRYVLTRSSILVPGFIRELDRAWPHMTEKTKSVVLRDILEHIKDVGIFDPRVWGDQTKKLWVDFASKHGKD